MDISSSRNVLSALDSFPSLCPRSLYKEVPLGHMVLETLRKHFLSEKVLSYDYPPSHTHTHTHLRALSGQLLFLPAQTHCPLLLAIVT